MSTFELPKGEGKKVCVGGGAGFIGSHLCELLLQEGVTILGIDNLTEINGEGEQKRRNLALLLQYPNFEFKKDDIRTTTAISDRKPQQICHLAGLAGVRNSLKNPQVYIDVNVKGFVHLMEEAVKNKVQKVVYASSSSVYGANTKLPFSENDAINSCISPYACSKYAMESFAKMYTQLYGVSCVGLRFFTVYGPRGRVDMAPYKIIDCLLNNRTFEKFGNGNSTRDYTYVGDIVSGISLALANSTVKCQIFNLGNCKPTTLNDFISVCESLTRRTLLVTEIESQLGDVPDTAADISAAKEQLGYEPKVSLKEGLQRMIDHLPSTCPRRSITT